MTSRKSARWALATSASLAVLAAATSSFAASAGDGAPVQLEELVVTAQRREENLQSVPMAVSAFSQDQLTSRRIEGGRDIQTGVPNVNFSHASRNDNIQIRGIGTNSFTVTGDTSTGVHFDTVPLTDNRLFETDFLDVERVEVLRGPQGTLYGRNATGGVLNVLPAKPTEQWAGMLQGEFGNYNSRKLAGMVNIPLFGDRAALRLAGQTLNRDGHVTNVLDGKSLDGRDLYQFRSTLRLKPIDTLRVDLIWQQFQENDDRLMTGKSLCVRDPGPSRVGSVTVTQPVVGLLLSQGCADASLPGKFETPNTATTLFGILALRSGLATGDLYQGKVTTPSMKEVESNLPPVYQSREDLYTLDAEWTPLSFLKVNYLLSHQKDRTYGAQDGGLIQATVPYQATTVSPGGFVNDPQLGASNLFYYYNGFSKKTRQDYQELRFSSDFAGPFNFNLGGNVLDYKLVGVTSIYSQVFNAFANFANKGLPCPVGSTSCIAVDTSNINDVSGGGHNYYWSYQPYHLKSKAAFGEVYWKVSDNLKFTGGLRYTDDWKRLYNYPVKLVVPGSGLQPGSPPTYTSHFTAVTGRAGVDWKPELSFTDSSLVYAFYSRGFKGGGPNSVGLTLGSLQFFRPEYVNSFEIGSKNTLAHGALVLNATAFYYDYKGYQISRYVNRIPLTENVNAEVKGAEVEGIWRANEHLTFNFAGGLLDTRIKSGRSLDAFERTQHDPNLTLVKSSSAGACAVPTAALGNVIGIIQQAPGAPTVAGVSGNPLALLNACSGGLASLGVVPIDGVEANLSGKELPLAPHWTATLGVQYAWQVREGWQAVARADYYKQPKSYARVFNDPVDLVPGWSNVNLSLKLTNEEHQLSVEGYVKNLGGKQAITNYLYNDDAIGLLPRAYLREPRTIGVVVTQRY